MLVVLLQLLLATSVPLACFEEDLSVCGNLAGNQEAAATTAVGQVASTKECAPAAGQGCSRQHSIGQKGGLPAGLLPAVYTPVCLPACLMAAPFR